MSSSVVAIFLSQAYHGNFNLRPYDAAVRFLLAIPIYLAFRNTHIKTIKLWQYGLPLGAIAPLLLVMSMPGVYLYHWRASTPFMHAIYFGDLALIFGFLALFSINLLNQDSKSVIALKILGLLTGIYISVLSQSRGGWIAIPVLLITWLILQKKKLHFFKLSYAFPLILLSILASYFFNNIVQQRIDLMFYEVDAFSHGQADTSIGERFQLWKAALYLYGSNPVFGVGPEGFANSMSALSQSGFITEEAAKVGRGEVHNQILANLVGLGIPGLVSILSIYFVPLFIFMKSTKSSSLTHRTAGIMGAGLTLGFFIFGLTVETFNIKMLVSFYSLTLAVLLATATRHEDTTV